METLRLTLNKKWFDLVKSGEKEEEYREIKPHWIKRFSSQNFTLKDYRSGAAEELILKNPNYWAEKKMKLFDFVEFTNGYSNSSPKITLEFKRIEIRTGISEWGAIRGTKYFVILLGKEVSRQNC